MIYILIYYDDLIMYDLFTDYYDDQKEMRALINQRHENFAIFGKCR